MTLLHLNVLHHSLGRPTIVGKVGVSSFSSEDAAQPVASGPAGAFVFPAGATYSLDKPPGANILQLELRDSVASAHQFGTALVNLEEVWSRDLTCCRRAGAAERTVLLFRNDGAAEVAEVHRLRIRIRVRAAARKAEM